MSNIIEVKNFSFKYSTNYILKKVNFSINEGECLGLLGCNGSGKTTLINCILGEYSGEGDIKICNSVPDIENPELKKNIGVVLDNDILLNYLTLDEYLSFVGKTYNVVESQLLERKEYWIKYFKLENDKNRIINFFSHGMRKKTQIIAAVLNNPKILIIDEPTNGLDIEMIYYLKKMLIDLKRLKITILISSHDLSFIEEVCDNVIIISEGKIGGKIQVGNEYNSKKLEEIYLKEIRK